MNDKLDEYLEDPTIADYHDAVWRLIEFHDLQHAVVWETTCRGCADLMDKLYERDVRDGLI